jgi:homocysteine S-methyltransferase
VAVHIKYPLLIDGGLSNQLESQGCDLNHDLWTANILLRTPEQIIKAHTAYLNAGSECIITASYQLTHQGLKDYGLIKNEADALILKSVDLAKIAVDSFMDKNPSSRRPLIAASIGPYGAYLADGSEYNGNYNVSDEVLHEFHFERIKLLDSSPADLLACETIPSLQEAKVLSKILKTCKKEAWMTFSCKNESQLNDGSSIIECVQILNDNPNVFAVGVNCTHPKYITGLIKNLKSHSNDKRIIVYPNHGEVYDASTKTWSRPTDVCFNAEVVNEWINEGADIIGGCCRVGPEDVQEIKHMFR